MNRRMHTTRTNANPKTVSVIKMQHTYRAQGLGLYRTATTLAVLNGSLRTRRYPFILALIKDYNLSSLFFLSFCVTFPKKNRVYLAEIIYKKLINYWYLHKNSRLSKFCFLLLIISDINYFHCVRIVELLKVSESGSKNIFGYYSSQRMKVLDGYLS